MQPLAVTGTDARAFLPPVLEGVDAEIGQLRGLGMVEDAENSAHGLL